MLLHDDKLALEYRSGPDRGKLGYEYDFNEYLLKLVKEVDWNIKKGHQRLSTFYLTKSEHRMPFSLRPRTASRKI